MSSLPCIMHGEELLLSMFLARWYPAPSPAPMYSIKVQKSAKQRFISVQRMILQCVGLHATGLSWARSVHAMSKMARAPLPLVMTVLAARGSACLRRAGNAPARSSNVFGLALARVMLTNCAAQAWCVLVPAYRVYLFYSADQLFLHAITFFSHCFHDRGPLTSPHWLTPGYSNNDLAFLRDVMGIFLLLGRVCSKYSARLQICFFFKEI
jgi:hypothetical protein